MADAAARGGAITLAGQAARFIVQLVSLAVLARILSAGDYGVFTMVFAFVGVATVLGDFGLSLAAIQSQTITTQQRSNLFWTNTLIGFLLAAIVIIVAPPLAAFYDEPAVSDIAQMMSLTFILNALSSQFRAELTARLKFRALAVTDILSVVLGFVTAYVLAIAGAAYWALVAQQIVVAAASFIGLVIAARWLPGLPRRTPGMLTLYKYGARTLGVQLFTYATSNVDSILLGRFSGPATLGLYDRAYQLFRMPLQQIAAPMTRVALPVLSKLQNDDRYDLFVQRAQLLLAYVFGGAFWILITFSSPLIDLLLGPGWEIVKPIFVILALGGIVQGVSFTYYWVFLSLALTGAQLKWTLIGRSAMVITIAVGVNFGPIGVAAGATIGQVVNWTLQTLFPMRLTGVSRRPLIAIAARPALLFLPLACLGLVLNNEIVPEWPPWAQATVTLAVMSTYLSFAAFIPSIRRDYLLLFDVARRFLKR